MPSIQIELRKGRTLDQKRRFVDDVTRSAAANLGVRVEDVRVQFDEFDAEDVAWGGHFVFEGGHHG